MQRGTVGYRSKQSKHFRIKQEHRRGYRQQQGRPVGKEEVRGGGRGNDNQTHKSKVTDIPIHHRTRRGSRSRAGAGATRTRRRPRTPPPASGPTSGGRCGVVALAPVTRGGNDRRGEKKKNRSKKRQLKTKKTHRVIFSDLNGPVHVVGNSFRWDKLVIDSQIPNWFGCLSKKPYWTES